MTGLTIQYGKNNNTNPDGDGEGGAFDFDAGPDGLGSLTMNDVVINQNSTTNGDGGGIALFDGGVVSITNSKFTNNIANGLTGGGTGGAIFIGFPDTVTASTKLTISGSTISGNVTAGAAGEDGGGILSDANFPVMINGSTISDNKTTTSQAVNGGGIADEGSGGLTIDQGTVISGNSASHWGGGLYSTDTGSITDTTIINNFAAGGTSSQSTSVKEGGGGISADETSADITISDSRIVGNTATVGGSQLDGDGGASDGGVLDAKNNWFGTNSPSSSFFGAGVKTLTTTPYLVMTFSASPTKLGSGSTSTLTASITTNSANTTGFSIPDGTPATFSGGTIGSVNPSSTTTTSGTATSTFTAGATAGTGNVSATIDNQTLTVQLDVVGAPTANPQTVNVAFDTAKAITLTGSDPNSPPLSLTFAIATDPAHGSLSGTVPNVTYTPNTGFHGTDSFTFTVNNGTSTSPAATVTLDVAAGVPTANPQSVTLNENASAALTLTGSDPDVPALPLTYAIVTGKGPAKGTISNFNAATGGLTYTPNPNYFGSDSFEIHREQRDQRQRPATVSLTVDETSATVSGTVGVSWGTSGTATLQTTTGGLLLPAGRSTDLPWLGIDKLSITLSQPAALSASDVSVTGISVANYGLVTVSGSGTNYTITLAQPIDVADRVTITIGSANIATYTRQLAVLPGDFNGDGIVTMQDAILIRNEYLGIAGAVPTIYGDINGDGTVNIEDYNLVRGRIGTVLPT